MASGDSNQEDYWENWGDFQKKNKKTKKAALTSSSLTTKQVIGLQYFSAPIHPVQLLHLLHTPSGSAADSQGLSHCHRWDLDWLVVLEDMRRLCGQKWWGAARQKPALIRDGKKWRACSPKAGHSNSGAYVSLIQFVWHGEIVGKYVLVLLPKLINAVIFLMWSKLAWALMARTCRFR